MAQPAVAAFYTGLMVVATTTTAAAVEVLAPTQQQKQHQTSPLMQLRFMLQ
jgi:hypothetical protein